MTNKQEQTMTNIIINGVEYAHTGTQKISAPFGKSTSLGMGLSTVWVCNKVLCN
jgi:hypothetical protein